MMWQTVELRELRLFLTLAEELHFGRTAENLRSATNPFTGQPEPASA